MRRTREHALRGRQPVAVFVALALLASVGVLAPPVAAAPTAKVVLIVMENKPSSVIVGSPVTPYLNSLIASGMTFSDYHSVATGSLHNYLAMTSGLQAITSPASANIFNALEGAGLGWLGLQESMGIRCGRKTLEVVPGTSVPLYTRVHDAPFQYRSNEACLTQDLPLTSDAQLTSLPAFTMITPNQCDDMFAYPTGGSCPAYFGSVSGASPRAIGDAWLAHVVPLLLADPAVTVFVTFDEGTKVNNKVYAVEVGRGAQPGSVDAGTFDHYGLLAGLYQTFGLGAAPNAAAGAAPVPVPDVSAPSQPTDLEAAPQASGEVDLSWSASTDDLGVAGYTVYRDGAAIGTTPDGSTTTFPDATAGQVPHAYTVTASDFAGNESPASDPASTGPSTPTNLALSVTPTQVDLSWDPSSDPEGVTGYTIYRDGAAIGTTPDGGTTTYSDVGVDQSNAHTYTVDAFDATGIHSATSDPASTGPSTPTNLALSVTPSEVDLSWDPSSDPAGVTGYTIYRDGAAIGTTPDGATTTYPDLGVDQSTAHTYTVDAFDAGGAHSAPSDPASTGPTAPTNLRLSAGSGQIDLSWDPASDTAGVTGYTIYRDGAAIGTTPDGASTTYSDIGVDQSTKHTYAVDAFDAGGAHSAPSAPVSSPGPPVVVIMMENHSYGQIESFPPADRTYLDAFAAGGVRFTDYTEGDGTGPSLPDYLQVSAGSICGSTNDKALPGKFGVGQGCPTTVWNQMESAGLSWGVYQDAMPAPCAPNGSYNSTELDTPYVLRHNPATPFASIWSDQTLCTAHVLPFSSFPTLSSTSLPSLSFVTPGICNDQHGTTSTAWTDCLPKSEALMQRGDTWLATYVPAMLAAGAKVIITYDESGTLYAAEQGPGITPGTLDPTPLTHYGLLRGIEDNFGLPCLNEACAATPLPI